ncbi:MAG: hypothetical protein SCH71_02335 [Desulfobulbaceae bacterium]|nr:hypothetical protein [Desulfobulbaceae bacterium]
MNPEDRNTEAGREEKLDNRVIPVMREAIVLVQMVLFQELKEKLGSKYAAWNPDMYRRLVGCIVNDIFGTPAQDPEAVQFARLHIEMVEEELRALADNVPDILPHLTDALRMQTLCDREEGKNTLPTLLRARALGVLQEERTIPMPSTFMIFVRQLGARYNLLESLSANGQASDQQE